MKLKTNKGFSRIELIVGVALVFVFNSAVFADIVTLRDADREAEVKNNLHTIQIAVERFNVDTDEYPDYILGGDRLGWDENTGCRAVTLPSNEMMRPLEDVLIDYGYLQDYPRNPFLSQGDASLAIIMTTGASVDYGDGDVRFGFYGDRMGNCLDDPMVLWHSAGAPTNYQYTLYPVAMAYLGVLNANSPNSFYCMGGLPEWSTHSMGNSSDEGDSFGFYWPGEFFYRAGYSYDEPGENLGYIETIWQWPVISRNKYILGAYGSLKTEGLDVIRLTTKEGAAACTQSGAMSGYITDQYYQDHSNPSREASHPEFDYRITYSNPEVFGGGESGLMPQFPYYEESTHLWMYGAPDGIPDGVILVVTGEIDSSGYMEW